ncbi:MAG: 50S ribosomal protein L18 [Nanoarchaeota archaeon]|nr:50S ribosomal protein L18 [Nanoarchaeota archaeon]
MFGPRYKVAYRRRRKGLTNYKKRLALLKSGKIRFVVRKSNNNVICQLIEYHPDGDKTLLSVSSKDLVKYGYKGHTGNVPAAYLTGLMCGLKAIKKGIKSAVFDMGLYRSTKGSRLYAALKGAVEAGLDIPHDEKVFPQERRIKGYHIADYAQVLKAEKPEEYEKKFFKILERKLEPEKFVEHFDEVKKRIMGEFS